MEIINFVKKIDSSTPRFQAARVVLDYFLNQPKVILPINPLNLPNKQRVSKLAREEVVGDGMTQNQN